MGQYYKICNVDKKEYISPYDFDSGAKLMEFAYPIHPNMITSALCILLADGNNRGNGDLRSENSIIGSWKYDRIVVAGDYADPNPEQSQDVNVYHLADSWKNISFDVLNAIMDDFYTAKEYGEYLSENYKQICSPLLDRLALAHKSKQYEDNRFPILADMAETFFLKLFPDKGSDYYQTINGLAKHSWESLDNVSEYERELALEKIGVDKKEEDEKLKLMKSIEWKLDQIAKAFETMSLDQIQKALDNMS